ncbi:MAG: phosphoribosylaminoimidazolesuccinocarboxamide synthase [Planctomycetes bacterium]|nr:phosphoribosylaminoimidazolesuccinocarboxamide synthase [Planctomycetota bacterium]
MPEQPLVQIDLEHLPLARRGKVRDVFDAGEHLLLVASDRLSAFDFVLPNPIPGKGRVLTALSLFWFDYLSSVVPNHLVTDDMFAVPDLTPEERDRLQGRTLLVKKADPLPAEFIVRGYLTGSGWKDYQKTGKVCGISLPKNLREADRLDPILLTPSTKADEGHDENISLEQLQELITPRWAKEAEKAALALYSRGADHARSRGIILCDTKFEFGIKNDQLILIDEVLTPDSSRFWPLDKYEPGRSQESFDKQFVRNYLLESDWDRASVPPPLPPDIIDATRRRYEEALELLTAKS